MLNSPFPLVMGVSEGCFFGGDLEAFGFTRTDCSSSF